MKKTLAVFLLSLPTVSFVAGPASASCIEAPPMAKAISEASAVFVGTVVETANMRRWVIVEVSAVWKGHVEPQVEVRAGPKDPPGPMSVASSGDRHYRAGETYLFLPYRGDGRTFRDSNCSRTTRYQPQLERFNPTGTAAESSPSPLSRNLETATDGESMAREPWTVVWWITGGLVAALGAIWLLIRSQRTSR